MRDVLLLISAVFFPSPTTLLSTPPLVLSPSAVATTPYDFLRLSFEYAQLCLCMYKRLLLISEALLCFADWLARVLSFPAGLDAFAYFLCRGSLHLCSLMLTACSIYVFHSFFLHCLSSKGDSSLELDIHLCKLGSSFYLKTTEPQRHRNSLL